MFDKKKETEILDSLTYKIKKRGRNEIKSDDLNQNKIENRNNAVSHKTSLENYRKKLNWSSEENLLIRKCVVPYTKSKKSIFKQQLDTYISDIEELKPTKEKHSLEKLIVKMKTERKRQMVNNSRKNSRTLPFIIDCFQMTNGTSLLF